jgi:16S rRNA (cytosine967-C5)-methyltransferase
LALRLLMAVEAGKAYPGLAIDRALQRGRLSPADRRLVTELVHGVCRARNTLDWALAAQLRRPLADLPSPIRNALRLGAYQLLYLDRIPAATACDESVKLARRYGHPGTAGLVNAVLRRLALAGLPPLPGLEADPVSHLSLAYHHPPWLVRRWLARLGRETTLALLAANNRPAVTSIRVNQLRADPGELRRELETQGATVQPGTLLPEGLLLVDHPPIRSLKAFAEGRFQVQDESSMLAARVVNPRPGWLVIDACAAPGGKTTHLAELMGDSGQVVAIDRSSARLRLVREAADRLGLRSIRTVHGDARDTARLVPGPADAVLVDAPCSGLGTLRRRSDLRWTRQAEDLAALTQLQCSLLVAAAAQVKPGGVLVYSTCSTEPEENEQIVNALLERTTDFRREDPLAVLPDKARRELIARRAEPAGEPETDLQLWPHVHGTDGFFLARLRRGSG